MLLKDVLTIESGLKYCIDELNIQSGVGRNYLMNLRWKTTPQDLEWEWTFVEEIVKQMQNNETAKLVGNIQHKLSGIHNIKQTIQNIENGDLLDDVQLFEVKNLALLSIEIASLAKEAGLDLLFLIPDLSEVAVILDPDRNNIAHFYIYESYDPRLAEVRNSLKQLTNNLDSRRNTLSEQEVAEWEAQITDIYNLNQSIEDEVRKALVTKLSRHTLMLKAALERLAYIDLSIAKAEQATRWSMCRPNISNTNIAYTNLFNPRLKITLEERKQRYQHISIDISQGVCLITGANMAGKTVLLKTMGIAQMLAQFGFFVPAQEATITLMDKVVFCIGDEQNEMNGLSSFASEILKINEVVQESDRRKMLVLIDEPARTTNPTEGKAIVQAIASIMNRRNSYCLITTHYSHLGIDCRKLRVKGFADTEITGTITPQNINQYMDYTLQEDNSDSVPHEALRIAEILNCNPELITTAKNFLEN